MNKIALFDFCETLIKFQTADAFLDYVYEKTKSHRMLFMEKARNIFLRLRFHKLLNYKYHLWDNKSINKRWRLYELKGMDETLLKDLSYGFYKDILKTNIISPVLQELKTKQKEGYRIGIVSGGFDIYIKHFVREFKIDFSISCQIEFKNGICTGKLLGTDCMREEKVIQINKLVPNKLRESYSYSDSISDLPLLLWATSGVVVSKDKHQQWIDNFKFREIIW